MFIGVSDETHVHAQSISWRVQLVWFLVEFFAIPGTVVGREDASSHPLGNAPDAALYRFILPFGGPRRVSLFSLYPRRNTAIGDFAEAPTSRYVYTQIAETRRNLCGRERSLPRRRTERGTEAVIPGYGRAPLFVLYVRSARRGALCVSWPADISSVSQEYLVR